MTKIYTLEVSENQLATLMKASEILGRLGIGQFTDALNCLPTLDAMPDGWHEDMGTISKLLSKHLVKQPQSTEHSQEIVRESNIAWDLYQVMRHQINWQQAVDKGLVASLDSPRNWSTMVSVCYDEPLKRSSEDLAKVKVNSAIEFKPENY